MTQPEKGRVSRVVDPTRFHLTTADGREHLVGLAGIRLQAEAQAWSSEALMSFKLLVGMGEAANPMFFQVKRLQLGFYYQGFWAALWSWSRPFWLGAVKKGASTAQAPALTLCLKKRNKQNCSQSVFRIRISFHADPDS